MAVAVFKNMFIGKLFAIRIKSMDNYLEKIIEYAANKNAYYRNKLSKAGCTLDGFELLDRSTLQQYGMDIISDSYKHKVNELFITHSSGSTGVPITVYWDHSDYLVSMRTLWERRRKYYGITPLSKKIQFTMATNLQSPCLQYKFDKTYTVLSFESSSMNSKENMLSTWKLINRFQPEWIYVQPSVLKQLIETAICNNIRAPRSIRYIECIGEMLYSELRITAADFFHNAQIASMYGSEEMNGIGIECPYHKMHIISDNVYAEIYSDGICSEYGEGDAVITHLRNYAQPLIRYMQGDIINLTAPIKCECGYEDKIIDKIIGRVRERVFLENDGVEINNFILNDCIRIINQKYGDTIKGYKFKFYKSQCVLSALLYTDCEDEILFCRIKEFITLYLYNKNVKNVRLNFEFKMYDKYEAVMNKYRTFEVVN